MAKVIEIGLPADVDEPVHARLDLTEDQFYWLPSLLRRAALSSRRAALGQDPGMHETLLEVSVIADRLADRVAAVKTAQGKTR